MGIMMSEWVIDTSQYEEALGSANQVQTLVALSADLVTMFGIKPVARLIRCRDCKRGSDIGTGDLVHCKLLDRMMLRGDYCSMGARES